jgi:hypothetical protein
MMFPKPRGRVHDQRFLDWCHLQPCVLGNVAGAQPCRYIGGMPEANHAGKRPKGRKADDDTCLPMCNRHHEDYTLHLHFFAARPDGWRDAWRAQQIAIVQAAYKVRDEGRAVPW